jgi:hypothetical protein
MNPLVEQYVRHARRFGDPRTVFESACEEQLPASELGYLAARLRRLKLSQENDHWWSGEGANRHRVPWPRFSLTEREKGGLIRGMLAAGAPRAQIVNLLGTTGRYVDQVDSDRKAEELARELGPVDCPTLTAGGLSGLFGTDVGDRAGRRAGAPEQLSTKPDLTPGSRVGRLTVIGVDPDRAKTHRLVRCDCGNHKSVWNKQLRNGTRSCGCLRRERMAAMREARAAV